MENYNSEQACREKFKAVREKAGITCKGCGGHAHYWLKGKQMWQCKFCSFRTSLRSGTLME
ncbi:transposase, partial [Rapidithrix thailandica]